MPQGTVMGHQTLRRYGVFIQKRLTKEGKTSYLGFLSEQRVFLQDQQPLTSGQMPVNGAK